MKALTGKQSAFIREYLVDFNGTQAAIRAGYSSNSSESAARALLRHPRIYTVLQRKAKANFDRLELRADQSLERYRRVAASDIGAFYNPLTHTMRHLDELPEEVRTSVEAVEVNGLGEIIKVKFWNKLEALKFLAKYQQLAEDVPPLELPPVPTTVNSTKAYLSHLSLDELRVIQNAMAREALTTEVPARTTRETRRRQSGA